MHALCCTACMLSCMVAISHQSAHGHASPTSTGCGGCWLLLLLLLLLLAGAGVLVLLLGRGPVSCCLLRRGAEGRSGGAARRLLL